MLFQTLLVFLAQRRLQFGDIAATRSRMLSLRPHPALIFLAEEPVEQILRNHLRRQGAIVTRPAHVAVNVLAVRFLRDADLQRMEARFRAHLRGQNLIDGGAARAASGVGGAGHQAAEGGKVAVALSVEPRGHVVDAADDMNIVPHRLQRRETRRQLEVRAGGLGNPIAFGNSVAVEPDQEARFDGFAALLGRRRIRGAVEVEHRSERRKPDPYQRSASADAT